MEEKATSGEAVFLPEMHAELSEDKRPDSPTALPPPPVYGVALFVFEPLTPQGGESLAVAMTACHTWL